MCKLVCRACGYEECNCGELLERFQEIADSVARWAIDSGLNVQISAQDGRINSIAWYRDMRGNVAANEYFSIREDI